MAGGDPHRDPLALDRETMRQLGYRTVDLLLSWLEREGPALRRASPAEMRERIAGPPPEEPEAFEEILAGLERDVLPFTEPRRPPAVLRLRPLRRHLAGSPGRPDRKRL